MYYETKNNQHGLSHDPFKACIVPRPIGWITTMGLDGVVNLAPYSFFNGVSSAPPVVMFSSNGVPPLPTKDTLKNVEETGEFVVNIATWDLRQQMNDTAAMLPPDQDEMKHVGLNPAPSILVAPPRVAESPIHMECKYLQTVDIPCDTEGGRNAVVFGRVVGIHINDNVLTDGLVDMAKIRPISRLGYMDFAEIGPIFRMTRSA